MSSGSRTAPLPTCRCAELAAEVKALRGLVEVRLGEVLARLDQPVRAARDVDTKLAEAIGSILGRESFATHELLAASSVDAELRQALDAVHATSTQELGHTLARLAKAGLLEAAPRRRDGRRWRVCDVRADRTHRTPRRMLGPS